MDEGKKIQLVLDYNGQVFPVGNIDYISPVSADELDGETFCFEINNACLKFSAKQKAEDYRKYVVQSVKDYYSEMYSQGFNKMVALSIMSGLVQAQPKKAPARPGFLKPIGSNGKPV